MPQPLKRASPMRLLPAALGCLLAAAPALAQETIVRIVVLEGAPGHSAVQLVRGAEQMLWDPGGAYGTERDQCIERMDETFCRHFDGFPFEQLKQDRRHDVYSGALADLDQMLAIAHLESRITTRTYTLRLTGDSGERAWRMIQDGARLGKRAPFPTDRDPMFCTAAVGDYLYRLDPRYAGLDDVILPGTLEKRLQQMENISVVVHAPDDPQIVAYIAGVRRRAGIVLTAPENSHAEKAAP